MARDMLQYDKMVEHALRGVVRQALASVITQGLPGNHHFYLTFRTTHPGVEIAHRLHDQYPQEMTIVLQHQYWGLEVTDDYFVVNLTFSNIPERLKVPYAALVSFVDPSVKFGLQFQGDSAAGSSLDALDTSLGKASGPTVPGKDTPTLTLASNGGQAEKEKAPADKIKGEPKLSPLAAKTQTIKEPSGTDAATEPAGDGAAPVGKKDPEKVVSLDAFRKK